MRYVQFYCVQPVRYAERMRSSAVSGESKISCASSAFDGTCSETSSDDLRSLGTCSDTSGSAASTVSRHHDAVAAAGEATCSQLPATAVHGQQNETCSMTSSNKTAPKKMRRSP